MAKKIIIATVIALLSGIGFWLFIFPQEQETYIAKIDNSSVPLSEYYVYLYEQKAFFESRGGADIWDTDFDGETSENIAKQNALSGLVLVKTSVREAQRRGIALTDDERKGAETAAEALYQAIGTELAEAIELEPNRLTQIMAENALYRKLFEEMTQEYSPDEAAYEQYFDEYYGANRTRLETREIQYIVTPEEETADQVREEAVSGQSFDSLVEQYAPELAGKVYPANDTALPQEVKTTVWALDEGQISPVLDTEQGYYVVRLVTATKPDMDALSSALRQQYVNEQKSRIFSEQYQKWAGDVKVTTNTDVWEQAGISALE